MFKFSGFLAPGAYAIQLAIRIGVFLIVTIASPLLMGASCRTHECVATLVLLVIIVKPLVYLAFIFSLLSITVRRLNDADLPAWLVVPVVFLLLKDLDFAALAGAHVALLVGYAKFLGGPLYFLTALLCLAALCCVPTREEPGSRTALANWTGGALAAVMLALVVVPAVVPFIAPPPENVQKLRRHTRPHVAADVERRQRQALGVPRGIPTSGQLANVQMVGEWLLTAGYWSGKTYPYRKAGLLVAGLLAVGFVVIDRMGGVRQASRPQAPVPPPLPPQSRQVPAFRPVAPPAFGRRA